MIVFMPPPNDAPVFGSQLHILTSQCGGLQLSDELAELFVQAREKYTWPKKQRAEDSQTRIMQLEQQIQIWTANLDGENARLIIQEVSEWGGNNGKAKDAVRNVSETHRQEFATRIGELLTPGAAKSGLRGLTGQPGVDLVMATKIYRFCVPAVGAAIDRHCSYFFNSLCDVRVPGAPTACTHFRREWINGKHEATRLASFSKAVRESNLQEYFDSYLPLLAAIAASLNSMVGGFRCAVSQIRKAWRPADVEMAAYQWWSRNGSR